MPEFKVKAPFDARTHVFAFLAGLIFCLSWPFLHTIMVRPDASAVYTSIPPRYRNYKFIGDTIAKPHEVRADAIFVGGSHLWSGIDAKLLEQEVSKILGRPAIIYNFGSSWFGFESDYVKVHDALKTLKPRVVFLPEYYARSEAPHQLLKYFWRPGDHKIPAEIDTTFSRVSFFAASILGTPHRFWTDAQSRFRFSKGQTKTAQELENLNGFLSKKGDPYGFLAHVSKSEKNRRKYIDHNHPLPVIQTDSLFYRGKADEHFSFMRANYNCYQTAYIKQIAREVEDAGGVFATVSLPINFEKFPHGTVTVRKLCDGTNKPGPHIGVSHDRLYPSVPEDKILDYYHNESHTNAAGAKRFSLVIAPAVAKIIQDAEQR